MKVGAISHVSVTNGEVPNKKRQITNISRCVIRVNSNLSQKIIQIFVFPKTQFAINSYCFWVCARLNSMQWNRSSHTSFKRSHCHVIPLVFIWIKVAIIKYLNILPSATQLRKYSLCNCLKLICALNVRPQSSRLSWNHFKLYRLYSIETAYHPENYLTRTLKPQ